MGIVMRSSRNDYDLMEGARYVLWAEKHRIDIRHAPAEFDSKVGQPEDRYYRAIDWGQVSVNGLPVAQYFVIYKNSRGHRFAISLYPQPRPPLPHPHIRVWVE